MKFKRFFRENSYMMVKLLVTHLCMTIFGIMVFMPFSEQNQTERFFALALSVCSVVFYIYLIHIQIWDVGAKDSIDIEAHKRKKNPAKGFIIGLISSPPGILLGIAHVVLWYFRVYSQALSKAYIIVALINSLWEGMFLGIKNVVFGKSFIYFFLIVPFLPAVFTGISYLIGLKQWRLFKPKAKTK